MSASPDSVSVSHLFDHAQARIPVTFIDYQAKRALPYTALELWIHAPDANGATRTPKDRT